MPINNQCGTQCTFEIILRHLWNRKATRKRLYEGEIRGKRCLHRFLWPNLYCIWHFHNNEKDWMWIKKTFLYILIVTLSSRQPHRFNLSRYGGVTRKVNLLVRWWAFNLTRDYTKMKILPNVHMENRYGFFCSSEIKHIWIHSWIMSTEGSIDLCCKYHCLT